MNMKFQNNISLPRLYTFLSSISVRKQALLCLFERAYSVHDSLVPNEIASRVFGKINMHLAISILQNNPALQ